MNIDVNSSMEINCEWYKKPTDRGVVSNFPSCAPIQQKKYSRRDGLSTTFLEAQVHGKSFTKFRKKRIFRSQKSIP